MMLDYVKYLVLLYISLSYVAVLYISSREAKKYKTKRDHPEVIKGRLNRLSYVMLLNLILIPLVQSEMSVNGNISYIQAFLNFGLIPGYSMAKTWSLQSYLYDIYQSLLLIFQLFIGPLSDSIIYYIFTNGKTLYDDTSELFNNLWGFRNYIFAPISEEIFYTSMLLTTYMTLFPKSELSYSRLILEPSLFFGIAHAHHAYESYKEGQCSIISILINTVFQMTYTTLFGGLTKYIFLLTGGNLWSCILLHSFCNIMGFPQGSGFAFHYSVVSKSNNALLQRFIQLWKKVYVGLLFVGIILFVKAIDIIGNNSHAIEF